MTLDWVIVRGGPGTWAKNADWDEYLIRVRNRGDEYPTDYKYRRNGLPGYRHRPSESRKQLVKGTKAAGRRYKGAGLNAKAGAGAGTLMVAGAVTGAAAISVGSAIALVGRTELIAGAALGGLVLAPALAVGGIFRGVNNSKVGNQIESRQTRLPIVLQKDEDKGLDFFVPMTPSPQQIEMTYVDSRGDHILVVDTRAALEGLHLVSASK